MSCLLLVENWWANFFKMFKFPFRRGLCTFHSSAVICLCDWIRYLTLPYEYFTSCWRYLSDCLMHHYYCLPNWNLALDFASVIVLMSLLNHLSIWLTLLKIWYLIDLLSLSCPVEKGVLKSPIKIANLSIQILKLCYGMHTDLWLKQLSAGRCHYETFFLISNNALCLQVCIFSYKYRHISYLLVSVCTE